MLAAAAMIASFQQLLGLDAVLTAPEDQRHYLTDWRGQFHGKALAVLRPSSVEQVAGILQACHASGVKVVPQGGHTGLAGGATPPAEGSHVVVSLERMNRVRLIDPVDDTMIVEAGCILQQVQEQAAEAGKYFPLSFGAEGSAQVGGFLSTNAGGTAVIRYGNARALTLGLEVVLPDGEIWHGLKRLRKDNTGYDLKQLFIGAEGTLGIITAAALRLYPRPRHTGVALVAFDSPRAAQQGLSRFKDELGEFLSAYELISQPAFSLAQSHLQLTPPLLPDAPWLALVEVSTANSTLALTELLENVLAGCFDDAVARDALIATSERQAAAFWRIRESISEAERAAGKSVKHDVSVPIGAVPDFLETVQEAVGALDPAVRIIAFGHMGDGNIHLNVLLPVNADARYWAATLNTLVHDIVTSFEGSISAEHGIGQYRVSELVRLKSSTELALMQKIKDALDPGSQMNPGKVLAARDERGQSPFG
jgi:FAD/FMN-containing dehydrogenase